MNKREVLIVNLSRDLAPESPRFQRAANSTGPCYFLYIIFLGMPVTILYWRTYSVVKPTLNGESISAARGLLEKQSKCEVAGQGNNDE